MTGLAAGVHAVHLPAGHRRGRGGRGGGRRGVGLYGIGPDAWRVATGPQLVLGFGNTTSREITAGIAAVADLLRGEVAPAR